MSRWSSRRRWPLVFAVAALATAALATTTLVRGSSVTPESQPVLQELRQRLLAPMSTGDTAFWSSGDGRGMGMEITASMQYDDSGRFAFHGRGAVLLGSGYDGTTTWKLTPAGETRTLAGPEGMFVRWAHWMITGYWAAPDAPMIIGASDRKPGRNEVTLSVQVEGGPLTGHVYVDKKRWLPKRFVINDFGQDAAIHFESWQQLEQRWVPRKVRITVGGKEDSRFTLDRYRSDGSVPLERYAPVDDHLEVAYDTAAEGRVRSKRGRWGHHFLPVRINGEDIGWIAFDTGASMTSIHDDVADRLGLEAIGEMNSTGIGGTAEQELVIVESIEIGPVRMTNFPLNVADHGVNLGISDNNGLLGMDILRHCIIDYDQRNSQIALYNPDTYDLPEGEWHTLLSYNGKPFVIMPFEGHEGLWTIDTGAPGGIIVSVHTVERLSLLDGRKTRSSSIGGIGGRVNCEKGSFAWVEWGGQRFENVPADFVTENKGAGASRSRDGIIGTDLLRRFRVVFDMQRGRIAYLPHTRP